MTSGTTITVEDLPADVPACLLRRLDGPSLAAASCATAGLRALAADAEMWHALCLVRWPSLAGHPDLLLSSAAVSLQRLFADVFPFPCAAEAEPQLPDTVPVSSELVSAVDVYHREEPLLSRVVETSTFSSCFLISLFCVDTAECKSSAVPITRSGGAAAVPPCGAGAQLGRDILAKETSSGGRSEAYCLSSYPVANVLVVVLTALMYWMAHEQ